MSLYTELKRRNVIRMAGLYLVGAWLIVQVASTLLPIFHTPAWVLQALVLLLALGLIPALMFSWLYELTPEGLKRDAEVVPDRSIAAATARRMDRLILIGALALSALLLLDRYRPGGGDVAPTAGNANGVAASTAPPAEASIAVLPFLNMSTDIENGFFADGISEELLNVLSGIEGLKVASRTSAFSFKGKDTPIPEIARQLEVRHVLEGSVRKQGQRVRITAQLIHAGSDGHLWSQSYDRELTDIFKVQEEIAQAITGELEGLLGKRRVTVTASTGRLEAYERFLRGRARFHQRTEMKAAIDDLALAVAQDPGFAEAWVYLAAAQYTVPGYDDSFAASEAHVAATASLEHARRLVPGHPMVLALQGLLLQDDGYSAASLQQLAEAARLSTQDSTPVMWLGLFLLRTGYIDEAIAQLERAERMEPRVGINLGHLATAYLSAGQRERALVKAQQALELGWPPALFVVASDLAASGERERAGELVSRILGRDSPGVDSQVLWPALQAAIRDPSRVDAYLALKATLPSRAEPPEEVIGMGRADLLLDYLEDERTEKKDPSRTWWLRSAWLPSSGGLREDPRFFAFAERYGLVQLWQARGYPPGCRRVGAPAGDRLDCAGMRR